MRHRIKHQANRAVLHWGLFSDSQMLPAAVLFVLAAGWAYAGAGGPAARALGAAALLLPVAVMTIDNRVGGIVMERAAALVRWYRHPGVFEPGAGEAEGYELAVDDEDQIALERERMDRVDLEAVFASDG